MARYLGVDQIMGFSDNLSGPGNEDPAVAPEVEPTAEEEPSMPGAVNTAPIVEEPVDEDIIIIDDDFVQPTAPLGRSNM